MQQLVTAKLDINGEVIVVDGYVHFTVDYDYGSDADGNRGSECVFVDEVSCIKAWGITDNKVVLSPEDEERAGVALETKFLEDGVCT